MCFAKVRKYSDKSSVESKTPSTRVQWKHEHAEKANKNTRAKLIQALRRSPAFVVIVSEPMLMLRENLLARTFSVSECVCVLACMHNVTRMLIGKILTLSQLLRRRTTLFTRLSFHRCLSLINGIALYSIKSTVHDDSVYNWQHEPWHPVASAHRSPLCQSTVVSLALALSPFASTNVRVSFAFVFILVFSRRSCCPLL